jgi:tetratricopeptide (TPR) repeat protein
MNWLKIFGAITGNAILAGVKSIIHRKSFDKKGLNITDNNSENVRHCNFTIENTANNSNFAPIMSKELNVSEQIITKLMNMPRFNTQEPAQLSLDIQRYVKQLQSAEERLKGIQPERKNLKALRDNALQAINVGASEIAEQILQALSEKCEIRIQADQTNAAENCKIAAIATAAHADLKKARLAPAFALSLYEKAAQLIAPIDPDQQARFLGEAGTCLLLSGHFTKSMDMIKSSLNLAQTPLTKAYLLQKFTWSLRTQFENDAAERAYEEALSLEEQSLGKNHPNVATILNDLAAFHQAHKRYEAAEPLYQRALDIKERALGNDHPDVAAILNALAGLYQAQGRQDAVEPLYLRALKICDRAQGKDYPTLSATTQALIALYKEQNRNDEVTSLYLRNLEIVELSLGKDHPSLATPIKELADWYQYQGHDDSAERLYLQVLNIIERSQGPDHPNTQAFKQTLRGIQAALAPTSPS